jgi:hypothetical protein
MLHNIQKTWKAFSIAYALSFITFFIIEFIKTTSPKEANNGSITRASRSA